MSIYSIYKITNKENGLIYIGSTMYLKDRFFQHSRFKFPKDKFDYEVIYQSKDKNHCFNVMEQYFIEEYDCMVPKGYNKMKGGRQGRCDEPFTLSSKDYERLSSIFNMR